MRSHPKAATWLAPFAKAVGYEIRDQRPAAPIIPPVAVPVLRKLQRRIGSGRIVRSVVGQFLEALHCAGLEVTIRPREEPAGGRLLTIRNLAALMQCPRRDVEDLLVAYALQPVVGRKYSLVAVARAAADVYQRVHGVSVVDEARAERQRKEAR